MFLTSFRLYLEDKQFGVDAGVRTLQRVIHRAILLYIIIINSYEGQ